MSQRRPYPQPPRSPNERSDEPGESAVVASQASGPEVDIRCRTVQPADGLHSKFGMAPPRHFPYPAVMLLLLEEPRHGYRLVDATIRFGFGPIDRPTIYRTLADLERDGLVTSWTDTPVAGSARYVYGVTDHGREVLAKWMQILAEERDGIDAMLVRHRRLAGSGKPTPGSTEATPGVTEPSVPLR